MQRTEAHCSQLSQSTSPIFDDAGGATASRNEWCANEWSNGDDGERRARQVQQAVNLKELRDVYVPIQLYNRKMSALLDTGCDTSIIGARLLPPGTHIEPTLQTLTAANGTPIPVEGIVKAQVKIGGHKQLSLIHI